jgi:hypothetical protein
LVLFASFVFFVLEKQRLPCRHAYKQSHPATQSCLGPGFRRDERDWVGSNRGHRLDPVRRVFGAEAGLVGVGTQDLDQLGVVVD